MRIQRTEESAALLAKLAIPRPKPGPAVKTQKDLAKALDETYRADFSGGILNLGGILIETLPESDDELIGRAEFVPLPTSGGFISAGAPRGEQVKAKGLDGLVVRNTLATMIDAEQIKYLRAAGLPNKDWKILIEVHYYRERDMSQTGFHKDTLGETLFVNLNYHMDRQVIGPEVVVNPPRSPEHDEQISDTLPPEFLEDLAATRGRLGEPTAFHTDLVDPYEYVAFVDEAIHHASPFYGHRYVSGAEFKHFLQTRHSAQFNEASKAYATYKASYYPSYFWPFYTYLDTAIISKADSVKWLAWMSMADDANKAKRYVRTDVRATLTSDEFDDVLETVGGVAGAKRTEGGAAGFHSASIPKSGTVPIKPKGRPPLKRRLSDADFRRHLPPPRPVTEKRTFFRTWVRVVPAAKAADLRKRLED